MKIAFDENVSSKVVPVLQTLKADRDHELVHVVQTYGMGTHDVPLFRRFADEGGRLLISGDVAIASRKHEIDALIEDRLGAGCHAFSLIPPALGGRGGAPPDPLAADHNARRCRADG